MRALKVTATVIVCSALAVGAVAAPVVFAVWYMDSLTR